MLHRCYTFDRLTHLCRKGLYPHTPIRAASRRPNLLFGVSPEDLAAMRAEARRLRVGILLLGSRVSGPRSRQRGLHPVLAASLPLRTYRRAASALLPAAEGVRIDKTSIKDFGPRDPRTSDLSVIVLDPRRAMPERRRVARILERAYARPPRPFPVRVFADLFGRTHAAERDFLDTGEAYLRQLLPKDHGFPRRELRAALKELYFVALRPSRPR